MDNKTSPICGDWQHLLDFYGVERINLYDETIETDVRIDFNKEPKQITSKIQNNMWGLYALFSNDNKLMYIGHSKDLRKRIQSHYYSSYSKYVGYVLVAFGSIPYDLEWNVIQKLQPPINKDHKKFPYYKSLIDEGKISEIPEKKFSDFPPVEREYFQEKLELEKI